MCIFPLKHTELHVVYLRRVGPSEVFRQHLFRIGFELEQTARRRRTASIRHLTQRRGCEDKRRRPHVSPRAVSSNFFMKSLAPRCVTYRNPTPT